VERGCLERICLVLAPKSSVLAAVIEQLLEFDKLGQLSLAGGNIRNIALNATFLASEAGESVTMEHLLSATKSEYGKLEKTLTATEIQDWI